MTHSLDHIAQELQKNPYETRLHQCLSVIAPQLPLAKVYAVTPVGETQDQEVTNQCLRILRPLYLSSEPSHLGVVSINGANRSSGVFVSTMNWDIRGAYPSVGEITIGTLERDEIKILQGTGPCMYDASLFGWEAARWFDFLDSARTRKDLDDYLQEKFIGLLPI